MTSPLLSSLRATINTAMGGLFLNATLTRDVAGTPSPDTEPFDPVAVTTTDYSCKAIHDEYDSTSRTDGTIDQQDVKLIILAGSLSVTPIPGDRITIRSVAYAIQDVASDPALATWICRARL